MKFGKVPEIAKRARPWAKTHVIGPPPGQEDRIGSLEAQIDQTADLISPIFRVFVELEEGDLEKIQAGNPIEFALWTYQMVPVSVQVWDKGEDDDKKQQVEQSNNQS